jgi:hypothetical protein
VDLGISKLRLIGIPCPKILKPRCCGIHVVAGQSPDLFVQQTRELPERRILTTGPSQRLAQGRNFRARLCLSAGQSLEFRLGLIDHLGEEVLLVRSSVTDLDGKSGDPPCDFSAAEFSWWNVSDCQRHDKRTPANTANPYGGPGSAPNPALVQVSNASNFVLYKIHLYNAPFFHVQLNSDKFVIGGIDVHTPYGATSSAGQTLSNFVARNTDGIDPGAATGIAQDGYIVGTTVSTGDDMVAIKGNAQGGANNIVIAHNHFGTGHGMSLGSATINGITNVHVYDLTIDGDVPVDTNTGASDLNGLRIKSYTGNGGFVKNILMEDVCARDEVYPIGVTANYDANPIVSANGVPPDFQNITVQDFHQVNVNGPQHADPVTVALEGDTQHQATITFNNVWVETSTGKKGGAPVLTVASTATLTGTMNVGTPPAGSDPCTGKTWWPAAPSVPSAGSGGSTGAGVPVPSTVASGRRLLCPRDSRGDRLAENASGHRFGGPSDLKYAIRRSFGEVRQTSPCAKAVSLGHL